MLSHEQLEAELAREASELSALRGTIAVRRFVAEDSGICGGLRADIAEDWLHQASGTEAPVLQRLGLRVWGSGFDAGDCFSPRSVHSRACKETSLEHNHTSIMKCSDISRSHAGAQTST